jgi:serine/threonine protein kinase
VYLAEMSTSSGFAKMVAVKLLKADMGDNPNVAQRMRDEARLLGMLRHKTIVRADDLISLSGRTAVIMEYVPGCNLTTAIDPGRNAAIFPHRAVLGIIRNVANALDVAFHRPSPVTGEPLEVLHRDIKPGNIRITPDGEVKVLDFGIARSERFDREAHTTEYQLGSLNYMAPELLTGGEASPSSDVYSLGVTFYECFARDRFGWAGEAEDMHITKVAKRIEGLNLSDSGDHAEAILTLIQDMLGFNPASRPQPDAVLKRCKDLEAEMVGPNLEEWASDVVEGLKDAESTVDHDGGELTGRVLFEEVSTASFSPQLLGAFTEEATIAVPSTPDVGFEKKRSGLKDRWPELMILLLLFSAAAGLYTTRDMWEGATPAAIRSRIARPNKKAKEMAAAKMEAEIRAKIGAEVTQAPIPGTEAPPAEAATAPAEPTPPPPAEPVAVRIASVPMGLPVFIDGRPMGSTPISNVTLTIGTHTLVIKDGDRRISKRIRVTAGGSNFWKYIQAEGRIR